MSELLNLTNNFERNDRLRTETERKFALLDGHDAAKYAHMREKALPIRQIYLSHYEENYSLRVREKTDETGQTTYTAALKDKGSMTNGGLERMEIETEISAEAFHYYDRQQIYPDIHKLRYSPESGIDYDFLSVFTDNDIRLEIENSERLDEVLINHTDAVEVTDHRLGSNEFLAHLLFRRTFGNYEPLRPRPDLRPADAIRAINERLAAGDTPIVRIYGRSGSGKSTFVREIAEGLGIPSIVLSTDDYNRGKAYLDAITGEVWTDFESPDTYDTVLMADDLARLLRGEPIRGRTFDFVSQEPVMTDTIMPAPVIFIEGIHASSPDFDRFDTLDYELPTSAAESAARRILREFSGQRDQSAFPTPELLLRYIIEKVEPSYLSRRHTP